MEENAEDRRETSNQTYVGNNAQNHQQQPTAAVEQRTATSMEQQNPLAVAETATSTIIDAHESNAVLIEEPSIVTTKDSEETGDDDKNDADRVALLTTQLEREMEKRRPDHFVLGVVCRSLGGVPAQLRANVWKELLGVARNERQYLDQSIMRVEEDLANQKVISGDACRTRGHDPFFKQPEIAESITKILTYYCKCRNIRYKQGMNEVLAPFLMLERAPPLPESVVFQLFYAMIDKFLPHVFVDREFKSLQCSFQLYRLLMLYHDPKLCHYLDQHEMTPELYVTPWFMTLFARNLAPELVFMLWDFFLLQEDPFLLHFVAYALVAAKKKQILSADLAMLPQVLSSITFESKEELEEVCVAALALSENTPRSFKRDLYSVCYGGFTENMLPFLQQLSGASSLQVYPDELVSNLMGRITTKETPHALSTKEEENIMNPLWSPKSSFVSPPTETITSTSSSSVSFIVLDCRPVEQYRECHLSLSYHIDPEVVASPDALAVLLKGFSKMKGCHFCFVGLSNPPPSSRARAISNTSHVALSAIARLARGISGEKTAALDSESGGTTSTESTGSDADISAFSPRPADFPMSPGEPGSLATEFVSIGGPGTTDGSIKVHEEHISVTRLVLMFLQKGFEHVSRLDGGFDELKKAILSMDSFAQEQLLVVAEPPTSTLSNASTSAPSSSSSFKLFTKIGLSRSHQNSIDESSGVDEATGIEPPPSNGHATLTPSNSIKLKTKATVSTLSQRLQQLTTVAKDAVASTSRSRTSSNAQMNSTVDEEADERRVVGEDEWIEVYKKTREALDKSMSFKDVLFQKGPLGILFQRSRTSRKYQAVVDSIVPDSQASESQQIECGDLLIAINGQSMANVPFLTTIELVKDAARPLVLRFQNPTSRRKSLEELDAISIPPLPPTLVSASHHSVCITWNKLSLPNTRYQLQYAKQSEFNFNPWISVAMKQEGTTELDTSGITEYTNGTLVGLDPGEALVFRIRCGNGEKWGPFSLSSSTMSTLDKVSDHNEAKEANPRERSGSGADTNCAGIPNAIFLPGVCPEFSETGEFYFRVVMALWARKRPTFDSEKHDRVFPKGMIIKCSERLVAPGTNQIFVRLVPDDEDVPDGHISEKLVGEQEEDDTLGVWAFENTPDGKVALERISQYDEDAVPVQSVPFQVHAKSVVSSILSASGIKSNASSSNGPSSNRSNSSRALVLAAPRIVQVFPVSSSAIVVTWDAISDPRVVKYQVQYAKNRRAAMWWTVKQDIASDMLKFTVNDLLANTSYLLRVRGGTEENKWGPYSEPSSSCKTFPVDDDTKTTLSDHDEKSVDDDESKEPDIQSPSASKLVRPSVSSQVLAESTHSAPLRTGSTFLDKAVAVASRLTTSGRRRTLSNSRTSSGFFHSTSGQYESSKGDDGDDDELSELSNNEFTTTAPLYVNLANWKQGSDKAFKNFRFYRAIKYDSSPATLDALNGDHGDKTLLGRFQRQGERELVLTENALMVLNTWESKREGFAVVEDNRQLTALVEITNEKLIANSIIFHFKREADELTSSVKTNATTADEEMPAIATDSKDETEVESIAQLMFTVDNAEALAKLAEQYRQQLQSK